MNSVLLIAVLLAPQADRPVRLPRVERLPVINASICSDANCKCGCNETGVCVCDEPKQKSFTWEWKLIPGTNGDQYAFVADGKQLGVYSISGEYYRAMFDEGWGKKEQPPVPFKLPIKKSQPSVSFAPQMILSSPVCST